MSGDSGDNDTTYVNMKDDLDPVSTSARENSYVSGRFLACSTFALFFKSAVNIMYTCN